MAASFKKPLMLEAFTPKFKAVQTKLLDALELNAKDPKGAKGLHIPGWLHLYRALNDCRTILVNVFRFLSGSNDSPDVPVQTLAEIAQNKRLHPVARALLDSFRVVPNLLTIVKDHEKMLSISPDSKDRPLPGGFLLSQGKQGIILKGSLTGVTHINFGTKGNEDPRALTMGNKGNMSCSPLSLISPITLQGSQCLSIFFSVRPVVESGIMGTVQNPKL